MVLEIKGTNYVVHVACVLKYTQSTHLARLAHQVLADAQQSVVSSSAGEPGLVPPLAEGINAANPTPFSEA